MKTDYGVDLILNGQYSEAPVTDLIGYELGEIGDGEVSLVLKVGKQHLNPIGTIDGGVLAALSDAALGVTLASTLSEGEVVTTIDLTVNYLRPAFLDGTLTATGKVIKKNRTVSLLECEIKDEKDALIAYSKGTFMILSNLKDGKRVQK